MPLERRMKMAEKKKSEAKKASAKKPAAKKAEVKKTQEAEVVEGKKEAAEEQPYEEETKAAPFEQESPQAPGGGEEEGLSEEETKAAPFEQESPQTPGGGEEEELSEEDFERMVEESLERVTVSEIVLTMMNQIASVGYLKMGLPESVNLKYRDLDQSGLAIDTLEGMIKGAEGRMPEEALQPFKGTLANLQLNFVQLKQRLGKN
jgi:hypothetical protein